MTPQEVNERSIETYRSRPVQFLQQRQKKDPWPSQWQGSAWPSPTQERPSLQFGGVITNTFVLPFSSASNEPFNSKTEKEKVGEARQR
jgi:hypothetical protein